MSASHHPGNKTQFLGRKISKERGERYLQLQAITGLGLDLPYRLGVRNQRQKPSAERSPRIFVGRSVEQFMFKRERELEGLLHRINDRLLRKGPNPPTSRREGRARSAHRLNIGEAQYVMDGTTDGPVLADGRDYSGSKFCFTLRRTVSPNNRGNR